MQTLLINVNMYENYKEVTNIFYQIFKSKDMDIKIMLARNLEEFKMFARSCKQDKGIIYPLGGDGTLHIVLNEIMGGSVALGVLPFGTGNDFYRSLDEYQSEFITSNVMKVNNEYALNVFSLGIDAEVCANLEKLRKLNLPQEHLYKLSVMYTFFKYKKQSIGINNFFEKKTLLAVCNGCYYGGGHKIAPRANIHAPEVNIVSVKSMSKLKMFPFYLEVINAKHEKNPYVDISITTKEIHIETPKNIQGEVDGELITGSEFKIIPKAGVIDIINNRSLIRELKNLNVNRK